MGKVYLNSKIPISKNRSVFDMYLKVHVNIDFVLSIHTYHNCSIGFIQHLISKLEEIKKKKKITIFFS